MKWTDDTSSGVSSARLAGWRPAWEWLSAVSALVAVVLTIVCTDSAGSLWGTGLIGSLL